jgi:hypothetical protein
VSDGLEDGRVVSGVGGQYNFVAMAHALPDGRSALLLRSARDNGGARTSNLRWNYGHATIPRHLRDLYITEHGIADVRGKTDEDCIVAMAAIADAEFQQGLLEAAKRNGKLRREFVAPTGWQRNTQARLHAALAPFRRDGTLPDYPLGSDFSEVEQRLLKALDWLQARTGSLGGKLRTAASALLHGGGARDEEALRRMALEAPSGASEWLYARLLAHALRQTA